MPYVIYDPVQNKVLPTRPRDVLGLMLEEMRAGGYTIGGEQSGHVVLSEFATTGDGVLTALHLMSEMK